MKRVGFGIAVSALAVLATSCIPTSENPLSALEESVPDSRLEGIWHPDLLEGDLLEPESIQYLNFIRVGDGLMDLDAIFYTYKPDVSLVRWTRYRTYRTELDGGDYLNLQAVRRGFVGVAFDEHKERGYRIVRYAISEDGSLTIWQMSWEAVARDIKQGKLAGTADGFEVYITDEAANLREYLRQTDDLFIERIGTYRKIPPKVPVQ